MIVQHNLDDSKNGLALKTVDIHVSWAKTLS